MPQAETGEHGGYEEKKDLKQSTHERREASHS